MRGSRALRVEYHQHAASTGTLLCHFFLHLHASVAKRTTAQGGHKAVRSTLVVFQFCSGMFLSCPVITVPSMHYFWVCAFCMAGISHYRCVLWKCTRRQFTKCMLCLQFGIISFAAVALILVWSYAHPGSLEILLDSCSWLFFFFEACGLCSFCVFPLLWFAEHHDADNLDADEASSRRDVDTKTD